MPRSRPSKTAIKTVKEEKDMKKLKTEKTKKPKEKKPRKSFKEAYTDTRDKVWEKKRARVKLHHSFRRSYREDYDRPLTVPGLVSHATSTLKILFKNWKLFGALLVLIVTCNIAFVGIMNQETYETVQSSLDESYEIEADILGFDAKSADAQIINAEVHAFNDFNKPEQVSAKAYEAKVEGGKLKLTLPACSVVAVTVK